MENSKFELVFTFVLVGAFAMFGLVVLHFESILGFFVGVAEMVLGALVYVFERLMSNVYYAGLFVVGIIMWYLESYARRVSSKAAAKAAAMGYQELDVRVKKLEKELLKR